MRDYERELVEYKRHIDKKDKLTFYYLCSSLIIIALMTLALCDKMYSQGLKDGIRLYEPTQKK